MIVGVWNELFENPKVEYSSNICVGVFKRTKMISKKMNIYIHSAFISALSLSKCVSIREK